MARRTSTSTRRCARRWRRSAGADPLHLAVGPDAVEVTTLDGSVVERKVPLPSRWLRGFTEVPVITSRFDPRVEVDAAEARAFLQRLPGGTDRSVRWVVPAGRSLRPASRPVAGAVCLPGAGRLVALRSFARFATTLRAYGPPVTQGSRPMASTWELATPRLRLSLTLSPAPDRGFSGEGAALTALAGDEVVDDAALAQLGTAGRVGYDVAEAAYFHRVLPYDPDAAARLNPRLAGARALVAADAVTFNGDIATVRSGEERYQVRFADGRFSCTCPWWGKHRGDRGPCKHALAAQLVRSGAKVPR